MDFFLGGMMYLMIIFMLSVILGMLGLMLGKKLFMNREKLSSFECGFDPMESTRNSFSLRFFLLAIVFLIFDIEIVLFLPYILGIYLGTGIIMKTLMSVFVLILLMGLVHEFNEGSLDWNS